MPWARTSRSTAPGWTAAAWTPRRFTRSAQAGCALATITLGVVGPQEYELDRHPFAEVAAKAYGETAAVDIEARLRTWQA